MRINLQTFRALGATSVLALALAATGCHSTDRTTGQAVNDTLTAHNVKSALSHDAIFKYDDVDVKVYNGVAQLTGFVNSDQQRARAAEIASHVQGIGQVINEITIKPTPTGPATIRDATPGGYVPPPQNPPPPR